MMRMRHTLRIALLGMAFTLSCGGDDHAACTQDLCRAGSEACCVGAAPGVWNPALVTCVCRPGADADADGDTDGDGDAAEVLAICGNGLVEPPEQCDGAAPEACTTTCGTSGMRTCTACAWQACAPPPELCNGTDDDCNGETDEGETCTPAVFEFTGEVQSYGVPEGFRRVRVRMWGAGGANLPDSIAGAGGYSEGELEVTPGEVLSVIVGGAGLPPTAGTGGAGGFGGGGRGGDGVFNVNDAGGGGGGGRSEVVAAGGVIVAGGGGGVGWGGTLGRVAAGGGTMGQSAERTETCVDGAGGGGGMAGGGGIGGTGGHGCTDLGPDTGNAFDGGETNGGEGGSDLNGSRGRGGGGGGGGWGGGGGGGASEGWSTGAGGGGGGRTTAGGTTEAGDGSTPARADDPDRWWAGDPDTPGRVLILPIG
ncbi:MAG: hypothetical protein HY905_20065 [Deltaproteobacteria bacterium]|nr:hypothetical protein [Deltaproteobacteria bacterium]